MSFVKINISLLLAAWALWLQAVPARAVPLTTLHPGYTLMNLRPTSVMPDTAGVSGMDFLSDGRLVICTWSGGRTNTELAVPSRRGKVYIVSNVTGTNAAAISFQTFATGLEEPLGLKVVNDSIYICEREQLLRLVDTNNDGTVDRKDTIAKAPGGTTRSEWFYGLEYKDGFFYCGFALAFINGGNILNPPPHANRGTLAKINKATGAIEYIAGGLRTPDGIGLNPDGEMFTTDNDGEWVPCDKFMNIKQGRFYGVHTTPAGLFDTPVTSPHDNSHTTPPAVWFPHGDVALSPSQPLYINSGMYQGQFFVGDVVYGGIQRVFLEKVAGEYQGCVFLFTQGLEAGVGRLAFGPDGNLYVGGLGAGTTPGDWFQTGKLKYGLQKMTRNTASVFEMKSVKSRPQGLEIEFFSEVDPVTAGQVAGYFVEKYGYTPTSAYGGNKESVTTLTVNSVQVNADNKRVYLQINSGLQTNKVIHIRLNSTLKSATNQTPWTTEAWYTINAIGTAAPFSDPVTPIQETASPNSKASWSVSPAAPGMLRIRSNFPAARAFVYNAKGALVGQTAFAGQGEKTVSLQGSKHGVYLVRLRAGSKQLARTVVLP